MKLIKIFNNVLFNDEGISDDDFHYLLKLLFVTPLVVIAIILCILLIYFATNVPNSTSTSSRFTKIESAGVKHLFDVVYDNETKVMYTVSPKGDFTVIINSDGTPLLYEGE